MSLQREVMGECTLYCGDCYALMSELHADALITDPPYGINFDWTRPKARRRFNSLHSAGLSGDFWPGNIVGDTQPFDPQPWLHFSQIIFWGAHLYTAWLPQSTAWLIWDKREASTPDHHGDAEMAWTNLAGVVRMHRQLWRGLVRAGEENAVAKVHPTQKPVALMRWCVAKTQGVVCDPFMGAGTTGVACVQLGRKFVGVEIEERYFQIACRRIEEAYKQPRLPLVERSQPVQQSLLEVS